MFGSLQHGWMHGSALLGAAMLHVVMMQWVMQPSPPVVIPDQQVIKISMVTPSQPKQTPQPTSVKHAEKPATPPKQKGMVKKSPTAPAPKRVQTVQPQPPQPAKPALVFPPTTGLARDDATEKHAAITKPIAADYLNNPQPHYPMRARKRGYEGTVLLDVTVKTDGHPGTVRVARSSGFDILDETALETVRHWQFIPARRGSRLVEAQVEVPISFKLN